MSAGFDGGSMFDISCKRATANQQAGTHCCAVCVTHKLLYSNIPLYTAVCIIQGYPAMEGKGDFDTYQHLYSTAGRDLCAGAAAKAVAQKKDKQSKAAVRICSNSGVTSVFFIIWLMAGVCFTASSCSNRG